jgi:hypothetical protein
MHNNPSSAQFSLSSFLRARPWMWIVFGYVIFVALTIGFVVIAIKNKEPEVPLHVHGR